MTSALTRRLERLLERTALGSSPERRISRIHAFDMRAPCDPLLDCQRPSSSAYLSDEPDLAGFCESSYVQADSPEELDAALASLIARGDVPSGDWERSDHAPCPGGLECDHLPLVVLDDGTDVTSAELAAMEGRA